MMTRRINGNDLIRGKADKEFSELFSDLMTVGEAKEGKYYELPYGRFGKTDKLSYDKALTKDFNNIRKILNSAFVSSQIPEFAETDSITIKHCCDPEGRGFFTIFSEEKTKYIPSVYELEQVGGAWSYRTWRSLFFAQSLLLKYLNELKEKITTAYPICKMEIKPLYLPWIIALKEEDDSNSLFLDYNNKEAVYGYKDTFLEDNKEYLKEYNECKESGLTLWTWYGGKECEIYFKTDSIIKNCVNEIYQNRESLEKAGLWEYENKKISVLYDMIYHRNGFEKQK